MDKTTFKQEISDYTARGGKFAFAFGDIHLPVIYHEALNILGVKCRRMKYLCLLTTPVTWATILMY